MASNSRVRGPAFGGRAPVAGVAFGSEAAGKNLQALLEGALSSGTLRLSNRGLTALPGPLFQLGDLDYKGKQWWAETDLHVLDVCHNELVSLDAPANQAASASTVFTALRTLLATHNRISALSSSLVASLSNLTKLDLSFNKLTTLPQDPNRHFPQLQELDVSNNCLESLQGLAWCGQLSVLRASGNALKIFEGDSTATLAAPATDRGGPMESSPFRSLRVLDLSSNRLIGFPKRLFHERMVLREFDCSANLLNSLNASDSQSYASQSLVRANFRQNCITQLSRRHLRCPDLKEFQIGCNRLAELPPDVFADAPNISVLDLSNNSLTEVSAVTSLQTLRRLDLQNNSLSQLPPALAALRQLTAIVLDGNPLRGVRREVVEKGTVEVLKYLRSRLTPGELVAYGLDDTSTRQREVALQQVPTTARLGSEQENEPPAATTSRAVASRGKGCRTNESSVNLFAPEDDAGKRVSVGGVQLVHLGNRSGTVWDLSRGKPDPKASGKPGGRLDTGAAPSLPPRLDDTLNLSILHNREEGEMIRTLLLGAQTTVEYIADEFLRSLPNLVELNADRTGLGRDPRGGLDLTGLARSGHPLARLILSHCEYSGQFPLFGPTWAQGRSLSPPSVLSITRLDLHGNTLSALPDTLPAIRGTLQFMDLSENSFTALPVALFECAELCELCLRRNHLTAFGDDIPWDTVAEHLKAVPGALERARGVGRYEGAWPKLTLLDVSYNDLCSVPNTICFMADHLRSLKLEGNRQKAVRPALMEKGTLAVLGYLRDRLPEGRVPL